MLGIKVTPVRPVYQISPWCGYQGTLKVWGDIRFPGSQWALRSCPSSSGGPGPPSWLRLTHGEAPDCILGGGVSTYQGWPNQGLRPTWHFLRLRPSPSQDLTAGWGAAEAAVRFYFQEVVYRAFPFLWVTYCPTLQP